MSIVTIQMISSRKSNDQLLEVPQFVTSGHLHGPLITDFVRGEILCASCGAVVLEKVEDVGPEQRSFTMEDYNSKSRTGHGSTLSIHDKGLSTIIGTKDTDAFGNRLSSDMRTIFQRLRTWDSRSRTSNEGRNFKSAFAILEMLQSRLELSDAIKERTAYLYRKAVSQRMTSGRRIVGILAASLYVACRELDAPRTIDDIARAANLKVKELSRDYRILATRLDLHPESYDATEFVSRISASIGISEKSKRLALKLLQKIKEKGMSDGRNPVSLAATAIFLAVQMTGEQKTQRDIAKASKVSSVTIRNVSKIIKKSLELT